MENYKEQYIEMLKSELANRCSLNPNYSLRAFARDLGPSASRLSLVMNKKSGLSKKSAMLICSKLNWEDGEKDFFCNLVVASDARSNKDRYDACKQIKMTLSQRSSRKVLNDDIFKSISSWYYFSILELTELEDFKNDPKWIASKLSISIIEAEVAISCLKRLDLLTIKNGSLVKTHNVLSTSDGIPSKAIRNFNRDILGKSIQSIDLQSIEERYLSTLTIALDTDLLPEITEKIASFRKELNQFIQQNSTIKKEIYCLSTPFFRLTTRGENNEIY